jgi:pimeloyl-ACP methyl ester carboxylesterase
MKYTVEGNENGKLIVFINGAGVSKWMWDEQKILCNQYKCLFFDLPGHGENCNVDFNTIEEVSFIIGLSIGGQIVLNMLRNHRDVITKAIVVSALNKPMNGIKVLFGPMVSMGMPLIRNKKFSEYQAKAFALPSNWHERYYEDSLKITKKTLLRIIEEGVSFNFNDKVTGIPTLILVGEKERRIMIKSAKKTLSMVENSIGYVVKGASHGIPYEKKDVFNELLFDFFEDNELKDEYLSKL